MKLRFFTPLFAALLLTGLVPTARADLRAYFARPEPLYRWEKRGESQIDGGRLYDLHLVSQQWQGITWEHRLQVFKPSHLEHPAFCTIYNTGGSGSESNTRAGMRIANGSGCMYAILYNIPNQPLYGGKTEDALVFYTWQQYMLTGDDTWPLHFPMAKAVLKSMDAIQEFAKSEKLPEIDSFLVYGGSKRGWTSWLVGASQDKRLKAIAPMVIDTLNVAAQMPHQFEAFGGKFSEQIGDYTGGGGMDALKSPAGQKLLALEDPYSYRDIITLPKLLVLGTNDRYWAQDALNLYWDGLKGPKWVSYTPNSGHGLEDKEHVFPVLTAFIRSNAERKPMPNVHWEYTTTPDGVELRIRSDQPIKSAVIYHNSAPTTDFRDFKNWSSEPISVEGKTASGKFSNPKEGFTAVYGEVSYEMDGQPYTLSTQIRILSAKK